MKKCPNCNHKLYTNGNVSHCKFCGYTNDTREELGIPHAELQRYIPEKKNAMQKISDLVRKSLTEYENFYFDYEEDMNDYAKAKQDAETKKILKRIILRMNKIVEIINEENKY